MRSVCVLLVLLGGCGPKSAGRAADGDGSDGGAGSGHAPGGADGGVTSRLRIDPMDQEVTVADQPVVLEYKALVVETATDVTAEATFLLDDTSLGTFSGSRLTIAPTRAGKTNVRAGYQGASGMTTLTVRQQKVIIGPGATTGAPGRFGGGGTPGPAPTLVYPADGVIVPQNMNLLELHFRPSARQDLFRLQLKNDTVQVDIYFNCNAVGGGCVYSPDEATWTLLSSGARGGTYRYTIAGVDPSGAVGTSEPRALAFSEEPITGGLYYWNAGGGRIQRYDFGLRRQNAEAFLDPPRAGAFACVGCHGLSRDGKKMAVGTDFPGFFKVFDVATRTSSFAGMPSASFYSFSPDSTQLLAADGASIFLIDAMTGMPMPMPLVTPGTMPDWSADGERIVYSQPRTPIGLAPSVSDGSIAMVTRSGAGFGPPTILVPYESGKNAFYPAFSPDGRLVVFNRSSMESFSNSTTPTTTSTDKTVWIVQASGGAPVRLGASTAEDDSWPKWAPDVQRYRGGSLMWLTFSSRRAYGLRQSGTPQLWMTAIDPAKAAMGVDPSAPAFWLPFQDPTSGNHIAQWVTKVERMDCTEDPQCPGEFCVMGKCLPAPG